MQHNSAISIAKGIGISLMVIGHASCPLWLGNWIYSFHMPLFFLITGFLFKEKYLHAPKKFVINKFKGYYLPFVKWSLIFLLFHNFLAFFNIYGVSYSLYDHLKKAFYIITLNGSEQLLGGYWFLIESLFASLIAFGLLWSIYRNRSLLTSNKIIKEEGRYNIWVISILSFLLIISAFLLGEHKLLIKIKSATLTATALFLIGYLFKKKDFHIPIWLAFIFLVITFGITFCMDRRLSIHSTGTDLFIIFGLSLLSILAILSISSQLSETKIGKILDFIGANTLIILTFHFLSFKLVNLFIILRDNLEIERLADFASISSDNPFDWITYSVVGIALPLLGLRFVKFIGSKFHNLNLSIKRNYSN